MMNDNDVNVFKKDLNDILNVWSDNEFEFANYICSNYVDIDNIKMSINQNNKQLRILHLNIRSLPKNYEELKILLYKLSEQGYDIDILLLCETFLNPHNYNLYPIEGYNFVHKSRQTTWRSSYVHKSMFKICHKRRFIIF